VTRNHYWSVLAGGLAVVLSACSAGASSAPSAAKDGTGGTLTIGLTASDLPPLDTVLTNAQGLEGKAFIGNMLYDGLTKLDLSKADVNPAVVPGLAEAWTANATATQWDFTLRQGVTFTDGTPWNADAALFNIERYVNDKDAYSTPGLRSQVGLLLQGVKAYTKTGAYAIRLTLAGPDAHLPEDLTTVYMASPTAVKASGLEGFAKQPVGTGPFKLSRLVSGQSLTMVPNEKYWGPKAKLDQLIVKPLADPAARVAALRSGDANFINYVPPDDVPSLKGAGYSVVANAYDQLWPWLFDTRQKPWDDIRVRQAANYAIDRKEMVASLLHGTADPAAQLIPHAMPGYSEGDDVYGYDPAKAKQLLASAGYTSGVDVRVAVPTSGSGNMIPMPMNEAIQHDLAAVGIRVTLVPMDWAALLSAALGGKYPENTSAMNMTFSMTQEPLWPILFNSKSPANLNHWGTPEIDTLLQQAQTTVDAGKRAQVYAQIGQRLTRGAPWLFVVNDRNPRGMSQNVHGFVQPRSWFVDLTTVWVS
jgi:peptide/nickel transport system substrate-binding protein